MNKAYIVLALLTATNPLSAAASDEDQALTKQTTALVAATRTLPSTSHSATIETPSAEKPPSDITVPIPSFCTPCDGYSIPGHYIPAAISGGCLLSGIGGLGTATTLSCLGSTSPWMAYGLTFPPGFAAVVGAAGLCMIFDRNPHTSSLCRNTTYTFSCPQNSKAADESQSLISGHEPMDEDRESLDTSSSYDGSDVESE